MTIAFLSVRLGQSFTNLGIDALGREGLARAVEGTRLCEEPIKILLVEDDGDSSFALSMLLTEEGFDVVRAADVSEAYADALAGAPDVVVTDIEMPVLSGLELIKLFKLRPALSAIPIIAMSALEKKLRKAAALGAAAVHQKPLEYERLISSIVGLIHRPLVGAPSH
jgi:two-component system chemotaxis response regulator CheY